MKYLTLLLLVPFIFAGVACTNHREFVTDNGWTSYQNPIIEKASLKDSLPVKLLKELSPTHSRGIKITYKSGNVTRYFKYEADHKQVVSILSRLPFSIRTNLPVDTTCQKKPIPYSLSGMSLLSMDEQTAASFFWKINPSEFDYYECRKGKDIHTVLISKTNKTILHRIESV